MRALAGMRPGAGRLDPRLYQYGGLWIYPVGALLKLASVAGLVDAHGRTWPGISITPRQFGRFYVVARLYAVAWGLVGVWAVYLDRAAAVGRPGLAGLFAGLCYICMPVVINMAHEAKPHLPGAVLQLLAVMAAMRYVETGRRSWWMATAALCGAAFGMVLSAWPVFIVLPVMVMLRPEDVGTRAVLAVGGGMVGVAVYLLTNPYIVINLFINREVLRSNFGNSLAMYAIGRWPEGVRNAARLVGRGRRPESPSSASLAAIIAGVRYRRLVDEFGASQLIGERPATQLSPGTRLAATPCSAGASERGTGSLLLAAPAVLILAQFVALAAGKPGEYGRFAVLPDVALGIAAVVGISRVFQHRAASRGPGGVVAAGGRAGLSLSGRVQIGQRRRYLPAAHGEGAGSAQRSWALSRWASTRSLRRTVCRR